MSNEEQDGRFVEFLVEGQSHAVGLERVLRVFPAVAVTALPGAPEVVAGTVNVHGATVAAVDMRARLGLAPRPVELSDHFLQVATAYGTLLLITDAVRAVLPLSRQLLRHGAERTIGGLVTAEVTLEGGALFVADADRLLTPAEAAQLEAALAGCAGAEP